MLGASFDSEPDNAAFAQKFSFPFRLLCDTDKRLAIAYGAAQSTKDQYPRRLTFVIGPDGTIEQAIETKDPAGQAESILKSVGGATA